jgi:hypothetical protein
MPRKPLDLPATTLSRLSALLPLALLAALPCALAGCAGDALPQVPAPLARIALPSGADLNPYDVGKPALARPQAMAAGSDGRAWVALTNLDASYAVAAPGMLVGAVPSTGVLTKVSLGGSGGHDCTNSGALKADGDKLFVTCTGSYSADPSGRGVSEVTASTQAVRHLAMTDGFQPAAVAVTASKVWVGDVGAARVQRLDRTGLTLDGPPVTLPCANTASLFFYVSDLLVVGGDLFVLCAASEGYLVRLDASTGAQKGDRVLVGAQPTSLSATGDGRIAVINSTSATLTLVTPDAAGMTVQKDALKFSSSAALQDVKARGQFVYTVSSGTNAVQKVDLAAVGGPKVVSEISTGDGTNPWSIVPLDDDLAVVSNYVTGDLAGVDFRNGAAK